MDEQIEWNELLTPAVEQESDGKDLVDLFQEPELNIVDHAEFVYLRGMDYGHLLN